MTSKFRTVLAAAAAATIFLAAGSALAGAEFKVPGSAENSFVKIGFLMQGQAEWTNTRTLGGDGEHYDSNASQNLFLRRLRILIGGNITPKLSFFIETDSPNLGKYDPATGKKVAGDVYIQDAFFTYSFADEFKIDGGMLLTANSHQSLTSAAGLLGIDYGPNAFLYGGALDSRVGRDYGLEARGYLFDKHLEYRAGIFQGSRNFDHDPAYANEPFRYIGRVVLSVFEPETGYFYTGTTLGKKQILEFGGSIDLQGDYLATSADIFWDQPIGNGDAFTFQGNYMWVDGEDTFDGDWGTTNLPGQDTYFVESQYYISAAKLGIWGQYAVNEYPGWSPASSTLQDSTRLVAGLAYWADGHNFNIKAGWGYNDVEEKSDTSMWTVQCQVFDY